MSDESRPARGKLDAWFHISARGSSVRQEVFSDGLFGHRGAWHAR